MFIALLLFLWMFFDCSYFIRYYLHYATSVIIGYLMKKDLWEESIYYGIAFTSDMDIRWHMNNARYLRAMGFARHVFWIENTAMATIKGLGGHVINGGNNIRYRKSIEFMQIYRIRSKIVHWDEKNFYMEQRFERPSDNFVFAIAVVKQALVGVTAEQVMHAVCGEVKQTFPEPEVLKWLESIKLSSERLRKDV